MIFAVWGIKAVTPQRLEDAISMFRLFAYNHYNPNYPTTHYQYCLSIIFTLYHVGK